MNGAAQKKHSDHKRDQSQEQDAADPPIENEHPDDPRNERSHAIKNVIKQRAEELCDLIDIVGHSDEDLSRRMGIEISERKHGQVIEHFRAQLAAKEVPEACGQHIFKIEPRLKSKLGQKDPARAKPDHKHPIVGKHSAVGKDRSENDRI